MRRPLRTAPHSRWSLPPLLLLAAMLFAVLVLASPGTALAAAPDAPAPTFSAVTASGFTVSWAAPSDGGQAINDYDLNYREVGASSWENPSLGNALTLAVTGLKAGTDYEARVRAGNTDGDSSWSAVIRVTTLPGSPTHVAAGSPMVPSGLSVGDEFRLLFLTSTTRNAQSAHITDYNSFVQAAAAAGHTSIRDISGEFRAVACTAAVDATLNTGTSGTGTVDIYWLGGEKVADGNSDFYDGGWDSIAGQLETFASRTPPEIWTGCDADGTGLSGRTLGSGANTSLRTGSLSSGESPLDQDNLMKNQRRGLYALSPVLTVGAGVPRKVETPTVTPRQYGLEVAWEPTYDGGSPITRYEAEAEHPDGVTSSQSTLTGSELMLDNLGKNRLIPNTVYKVRVRAKNARGEGPWSDLVTVTTPADTSAPVLQTARVRGTTLTLTYDDGLDEGQRPAASAFSVDVGGTAAPPSAVLVSPGAGGNLVRLTLGTAVTAGQTVQVSYTAPGTNPLTSLAGIDAPSFSNQAVENLTGLPDQMVAPTVTPGPYNVDVSWSEPSEDGGSDITAYKTELEVVGGATKTKTVQAPDLMVTLGNYELIPGAAHRARVRAVNANGDGPWSAWVDTMTLSDTSAPALQFAAVRGTSLTLTYDDGLDGSSSPAASDYTVSVAGTDVTPSSVIVGLQGGVPTVTLTLPSAVTSGQTVTVSYTAGTNPLRNKANVNAANLTARAVTNLAGLPGRMAAPTLTPEEYNMGVSWAAPAEDGGSAVTQYKIELEGPVSTNTQTVDAPTLTATLGNYGLIPGSAYRVRIRAVNANGDGPWSAWASATTLLDRTTPSLTGFKVSFDILTLTFSDGMDRTFNPGPAAFAVDVGSTLGVTVDSVGISNQLVTLTLANPVRYGQTVTLNYTPPATNALQNLVNLKVGILSGQAVDNITGPGLSSAVVNGDTLTLTYDRTLDTNSVPDPGDFSVDVDSVAATVSNVAVSGRTVTLTLASPVTSTATVTVGYNGGDNPIRDAANRYNARSLLTQSVTNNTPAISVVWAGGFTEAGANNGSVEGDVTATLSGDTFTAGVANGTGVTVTNLPAGLSASYALNSGRTEFTLTLRGRASSHANADDVSNLTVTFADAAFTGSTAVQVANSTKSDLAIDFNDPVPGAPTNLALTAGVSMIGASWTAPATTQTAGAPTGYTVEWSTDGSTWSDTGVTHTGTAVTATITGLTNGTLHFVRVAGTNAGGTGAYATQDATPSAAPTPQSATLSGDELTITFNAPLDAGSVPAASAFDVQVDPDGAGTQPPAAAPLAATDPVTISGMAVTLTLATAVNDMTGTATVAYTKPAANQLRHATATDSDVATFGASAVTVTNIGPRQLAVTNLTARRSGSSIILEWEAPSGTTPPTGYEYRRSTDGGTTWSPDWTATTGAATSYTFGRSSSLSYTVEVRATDSRGGGVETRLGPPGAPTGLTLTAGDRQIGAAWTAPAEDGGSAVTGYVAQRAPSGSTSWTSSGVTVDSANLTATLARLNNGTAYQVRVAAFNALGNGAYTTAPATATPQVPLPGAPTNLALTVGDTELTASWTAPATTLTEGRPTGYILEYSDDSGTTWTEAYRGTSRSRTITGLTNGTAYQVRVAATNAAGTGPYSATATETPVEDPRVPGIPTDLAVTVGDAQLALSWTAPTDQGNPPMTGYSVEYRASGSWLTDNVTISGTTATITGLTNARTYSVRVAAVNPTGNSRYATGSGRPVEDPRVPGEVTGLTLDPTEGQIRVTWTAPEDVGNPRLNGYSVQYRAPGDASWTDWTHRGAGRAATITGLTNGTVYLVRVAATNTTGTGAYVTASARPTAPPTAPRTLTLSVGNQRVDASWTAPASDGGSPITRYVVETAPRPNGPWQTSTANRGTDTRATLTGVADGVTLYVRVAAWNGRLGAYAQAAARPGLPPGPPRNITLDPGSRRLTVEWDVPRGSPTPGSYTVEHRAGTSGDWTARTHRHSGSFDARQSLTISGLTNGTAYQVRVSATNNTGTGADATTPGPYSDFVRGTPESLPGTPRSLALTAGDRQVRVSWAAPRNAGTPPLSGYAVQYRTGSSGDWRDWRHGGTGAETTITGLSNGTTYQVRVAALSASGMTGSYTSPRSATTTGQAPEPETPPDPVRAPDAPAGLSATDTGQNGPDRGGGAWREVKVSWTPAGTGSQATGYKLQYRSTNCSGDGDYTTEWFEVEHSGTSYKLRAFDRTRSMDFRVKAYNDGGDSPFSDIAPYTNGGTTCAPIEGGA